MNTSTRFTHPLFPNRSVTEDDLAQLQDKIDQLKLKQGVDLGIELPFELPVIGPNEYSPANQMNRIRISMLTSKIEKLFNAYSGKTFALDEPNVSFVDMSNMTFWVAHTSINIPADMAHHIQKGLMPYIHIGRDGFLYWLSEDVFLANEKWDARLLSNNKKQKVIQNAFLEVENVIHGIDKSEQQKRLSKLPFKWHSCVQPVKSGLSDRSQGAGKFKKSVQHLLLLDNVNNGRLLRRKHQLLCTETKSPLGRDLLAVEINNYALPAANSGAKPELITCSACLKRIEQFLENAC